MARSKHNTTGNGTHRQRIFKAKQAMIAFRKAAIQAEKDKIKQMAIAAAQPVDVTDMVIELPATEPSAKDDGLGHSHEDENLQDTMRELKGMVANDKHEQLMDTFVEEKSDAV